jgi:hypothetical protein
MKLRKTVDTDSTIERVHVATDTKKYDNEAPVNC